jgi:hypothetical protein
MAAVSRASFLVEHHFGWRRVGCHLFGGLFQGKVGSPAAPAGLPIVAGQYIARDAKNPCAKRCALAQRVLARHRPFKYLCG